jgi:hypothetical protein
MTLKPVATPGPAGLACPARIAANAPGVAGDGQLTVTVSAYLPFEPVQAIASPHDVRLACTIDCPAALAA